MLESIPPHIVFFATKHTLRIPILRGASPSSGGGVAFAHHQPALPRSALPRAAATQRCSLLSLVDRHQLNIKHEVGVDRDAGAEWRTAAVGFGGGYE